MKTIDEILSGESIEHPINSRYKISGNGIYVVMDKDKTPIYIGYSGNFKQRIYSHYSRLFKFMPDGVYIKFIFHCERKYEKIMIHNFKPKYNGIGLTGKAGPIKNHLSK